MKLFWPLAAFLAACGSSATSGSTQYKVDGLAEKFCVPNELTVQAPWWVPEDKPGTPSGFAFSGCWSDRDRPGDCPFPRNIQGGTVHGLNYTHPRTYAAIPADAFLRTVLSEPDTIFSVDDSGHYVSAHNKRLWQDWYIWRVSVLATSGARPVFTDDDALLATCHASSSVQKPLADSPENIFCKRSFVHGRLSFDYSFESYKPVPTDFTELDKVIVSVVNGWRFAV
jgi:hypothetical protein